MLESFWNRTQHGIFTIFSIIIFYNYFIYLFYIRIAVWNQFLWGVAGPLGPPPLAGQVPSCNAMLEGVALCYYVGHVLFGGVGGAHLVVLCRFFARIYLTLSQFCNMS